MPLYEAPEISFEQMLQDQNKTLRELTHQVRCNATFLPIETLNSISVRCNVGSTMEQHANNVVKLHHDAGLVLLCVVTKVIKKKRCYAPGVSTP